MADFVRVAGIGDVPEGEGRLFEIRGKQIALFKHEGRFYAIDNVCKHQGGPLAEGELDGTTVICPWHGWTYDITTGRSPDDPDCAVDTYPVKVEGEDVFVAV